MRIPKSKIKEITAAYKASEIKKLGNGCFSVPSRFFALGITPRMVAAVVGKIEK